jgi:uncharacterized protein YprB with RNaseH-like and TPR domain
MKRIHWLLPLMLLQSAWADKVESTDLKFAATTPVKMRQSSASNSSGKVVNFEGKDEASGFVYQIQVDQSQEASKAAGGKEDLLKPTLEKSLKAYADSVKAADPAVKKEWKKAFSKDAVFFDFETAGYSATGDRSSHSGVKFLHNDAIFTVQVIAPGAAHTDEAKKALLEVMKTFSLLAGTNAPGK